MYIEDAEEQGHHVVTAWSAAFGILAAIEFDSEAITKSIIGMVIDVANAFAVTDVEALQFLAEPLLMKMLRDVEEIPRGTFWERLRSGAIAAAIAKLAGTGVVAVMSGLSPLPRRR